jgi:hypothetical protein
LHIAIGGVADGGGREALMGQRTKGKMWCRVCGPVLGVKNTHRVRNTAALVLPGALLFGKVEGY